MKLKLATLICLLSIGFLNAQDKLTLEQEYDIIMEEWETISADLKTYQGLISYCKSDDVKRNAIQLLGIIHHYDSLVLQILTSPEAMAKLDSKEQKSTLKEIEKFESEYSVSSFITKLNDECKFAKEIEKDKKYSKDDLGDRSYDGQVYILETDIKKYINHIDSRVEHIDSHLHKLHIDDVKVYRASDDD